MKPISPLSQTGVAPELKEGLGGGLEQQPVDDVGMPLGQGVEFVRQAEHDMPVADIQQIGHRRSTQRVCESVWHLELWRSDAYWTVSALHWLHFAANRFGRTSAP
ncbi:MAG: hypothetical protein OXQ27_07095 [Chloroflexota bacterium]|nr:hypothetical protein [Chloroflexota bacterium]